MVSFRRKSSLLEDPLKMYFGEDIPKISSSERSPIKVLLQKISKKFVSRRSPKSPLQRILANGVL